jgi:Flp pilus assembly protein TadG
MLRRFSLVRDRVVLAAKGEARNVVRLWRDRSAATAVTFALLSVPLVALAGGGADLYMVWQHKGDLQSVADGAVMAGAIAADNGNSDDSVKTTVKSYITTNFDTVYKATTTVTTTLDSNLGQVSTEATTTMPTSFLKIVGVKSISYSAKSAATYGGGLMEVALAIDVTGSMDGAKLTAAKAAAKDLAQTLFTVPGTSETNDKVKMSLVPFARYVNIGTSSRGQSWLDVADDKSWKQYDCWDTWPGSYCMATKHVKTTCYNDGTPYSCEWDECTQWSPANKVQQCAWNNYSTAWNGCVGSRAGTADLKAEASSASKVPGLMDTWCNAELVRLTKTQGKIISGIETLSAWEETYIAPGMLWAWRTLSPKAPFADGSSDTKVKKAIILMTDGANTISATAPWHWGNDVAASNDTLAKTCANAKADGIAIYTIAFQVTDATIKKILTDCATSSSYFYDSTNISAMQSAFKQIGSQLSSRRLVY